MSVGGRNEEFRQRRKHAEIVGFHFVKPGTMKKRTYSRPHISKRTGDCWPRPARWKAKWTGWLTHREYDVIDFWTRFEIDNMHKMGSMMGIKDTAVERLFHTLVEVGILTGSVDQFRVTKGGLELFEMTDQFMLELDLGEE